MSGSHIGIHLATSPVLQFRSNGEPRPMESRFGDHSGDHAGSHFGSHSGSHAGVHSGSHSGVYFGVHFGVHFDGFQAKTVHPTVCV